ATGWDYEALRLEDQSVFWSRHFRMIRQERVPAYHRLDFRVSREFQVRGNILHAFVDVYNVYNRMNLESYQYAATYTDSGLTMVRLSGQEQLPLLPTFGLRYEF
ncbi:MAG: hypothetical protein KAJ42_03915, partial [Gemmatimonadetes bacterium]|nr:hypothetical protein [Gemmatimonadota bacterium]